MKIFFFSKNVHSYRPSLFKGGFSVMRYVQSGTKSNSTKSEIPYSRLQENILCSSLPTYYYAFGVFGVIWKLHE